MGMTASESHVFLLSTFRISADTNEENYLYIYNYQSDRDAGTAPDEHVG